jgi:hypothetical protein
MGKIYYSKEIEGIAEAADIPVGKIAMLQIAYEVFAACTSVVVDMPLSNLNTAAAAAAPGADSSGSAPFHIRTMDWSMEVLKALTIEVDYMRGGCLVARATTWAGYVGILTGMKPGVASVSVNYRRTIHGERNMVTGVLTNLLRGLGNAWPVSFLVREALLEEDSSFQSMVGMLESCPLMAPTYITVAGALAGEGRVITRDRDESVFPWSLDTQGDIVQTNMDDSNMHPETYFSDGDSAMHENHDWQDICNSRYRERAARIAIAHMHRSQTLTPENFWALFSIAPCLADDTVYTVAMCPRTGMYVTRAKVSSADKKMGRRTWRRIIEAGIVDPEAYTSGATRI